MLKFKNKKVISKQRQNKSPSRLPAFSYYNNRPADISSSKSSRPRLFGFKTSSSSLKKHLRNLPTYIAAFLILGSLLYALLLDTQPKVLVGRAATSNSLLRNEAVYQQAIATMLSKSVFNRTKLTTNTQSIESQIKKTFPEIQEATVTLPIIGRRPIIGLDPAEPTFIVNSSSGSFIIGKDGRALIKTSDIRKSSQPVLPIIQDDSGLSIEQGSIALPKEYVAFITTLIEQLSAKKLKVQNLQLPAIINELRVTVTGQKYFIKLNLDGDARQQVGTYLTVKEKLQSQNVTPAEYIDVRISERAYYK